MENKPDNSVAEIRRAYYKDWRVRNKDKVKQHNLNFWIKKAQQSKLAEEMAKNDSADNQ